MLAQAVVLALGCWAQLGSAQHRGSQTPSDVHPWLLSAPVCYGGLSCPWVFASPSSLTVLPINYWKEKWGALGRDSHMLEGSALPSDG